MARAVGALIRRELLRECRQGRHYVGRSLLVGILAALVAWRLFPVGPPATGPVQSVLAQYGTELFGIWALVQYFAAIGFATVRSGALAEERRRGTLSLARITALGDRGVVLGWFTSVMGRVLFTMALTLPVLVIARSFGGFTLGQLAWVVVVTVLAAAHSAALTLAIAALSASAGAAVAVSVVVQALLHTRPLVLSGPLAATTSTTVLAIVISGAPRRWQLYGLAGLVLGAACMVGLVLAYLKLAGRLLRAEPPRPGQRLKKLFSAADRFFLERWGSRGVLWKSGLGPCSGNPVLWRERAASPVGQRDHLIRLAYWVMVPVTMVSAVAGFCLIDLGPLVFLALSLVLVPLLLVAVLLLSGPATTFARERQEGTLPLLAATPLPARTIVFGKYLFALRLLLVPVVLLAVFFTCYGLALGFSIMWDDLMQELGLRAVLQSPSQAPALVLSLPVVVAALLYIGLGAKGVGKALGAGLAFLGGVFAALAFLSEWALSELEVLFFRFTFTSKASVVLCAATLAFLVAGTVLAPRVRWAAHAVAVGPLVALALLIVGSVRRALEPGYLWQAELWIVSLQGLAIILFVACALFLLGRAVMHAGPGVANRACLAVLAFWFPYSVDRTLFGLLRNPFSHYGSYGSVGCSATALFVVLTSLTVLFLAASVRQLDGFLERNG